MASIWYLTTISGYINLTHILSGLQEQWSFSVKLLQQITYLQFHWEKTLVQYTKALKEYLMFLINMELFKSLRQVQILCLVVKITHMFCKPKWYSCTCNRSEITMECLYSILSKSWYLWLQPYHQAHCFLQQTEWVTCGFWQVKRVMHVLQWHQYCST